MSFAEVDYSECSEKCRCQQGSNAGQVYSSAKPCIDGYSFDEESCDCLLDLPCDTVYEENGSVGTYSKTFNLSNPSCANDSNVVRFYYEALNIPDTFIVSGDASFETGLTSGNQLVFLPLSGKGQVKVTVIGSQSGTLWNYAISRECNICEKAADQA